MRRKIEKKKITFSISLDIDVLNTVNETIANRSKFIETCIVNELCKSEEIKSELKKKFIIL
jgi:metal-responsive CopG/Arc/MetJ family transcriptional regulator